MNIPIIFINSDGTQKEIGKAKDINVQFEEKESAYENITDTSRILRYSNASGKITFTNNLINSEI